jgi:hypothetical protein
VIANAISLWRNPACSPSGENAGVTTRELRNDIPGRPPSHAGARATGGVTAEAVPDAPLRIELLDAATALAGHRGAWAALVAQSETANAFALPCAFDAWRRTLAADVEPGVLIARRGEDLVGVMAIMRATVRRGPSFCPRHDFAPADRVFLAPGRPRPFRLRQISPVVSVAGTMTVPAPLCRAADRTAVIRAMAAQLPRIGGWDVMVTPVVEAAGQQDWIDALRAAGLRPWALELHRVVMGIARVEPFEAVVARQNRNFRRNIRRAREEADRIGLAIDICEGAEAVARLDALAEVAGASWKSRPREDLEITVPYEGAQRRFYEALVRDADMAQDGACAVLAIATVAGAPVAAVLCLRHGDSLTAGVTFHSHAFPKASPGLLSVGGLIDWAFEKKLARFDLNGTHEWIRHLADEARAVNHVGAFAPTARGRWFGLLHGALRAVR